MKKILLICNTSQNIITFRRNLIITLQEKGYEVYTIVFNNAHKKQVDELGVKLYCIEEDNRSLNPLRILSLKKKYFKIIKEINPDIVFTFQLKPNTFGVFAAKKAGVKKIYSMVEGAGEAFLYNSLKWKIIRVVESLLYKMSFKHCKKVFFLNNEDKEEFTDKKLVKESQCVILHGIGVDLVKFAYTPVNTQSNSFLMVGRLVEAKGIFEYIKCAEIVKKVHPEAQFNYLGEERTLKVKDIQCYIDKGIINYLGTTIDVRPYLQNSLLFLLPSKNREGLPMSIMEAESTGRGIITSNNIGCKDTVVDGYNGYLVDQKDYIAMAGKCIYVLEHKERAVEFGKNSRLFAEKNFDQKEINKQILSVILGDK